MLITSRHLFLVVFRLTEEWDDKWPLSMTKQYNDDEKVHWKVAIPCLVYSFQLPWWPCMLQSVNHFQSLALVVSCSFQCLGRWRTLSIGTRPHRRRVGLNLSRRGVRMGSKCVHKLNFELASYFLDVSQISCRGLILLVLKCIDVK